VSVLSSLIDKSNSHLLKINLNVRTIGNKKTKLSNLVENKSQKYKTFPTEFKSSPPLVELHTSPIQSTTSKSLVSSSITNSNTKILATPISNTLFPQQELKTKMSNSISMNKLKVISLRDASASSLISTQLLSSDHNQMKPDVTLAISNTSGINKDE
jgi:hypothetical protein